MTDRGKPAIATFAERYADAVTALTCDYAMVQTMKLWKLPRDASHAALRKSVADRLRRLRRGLSA